MQKSFIERIFPHSPGSLLPQSEFRDYTPRSPASPPKIVLRDDSETARSTRSSGSGSRKLQPAPLSASVVHYDDPFLPIDRAAKALQKNVQNLLDVQSDRLSAGLGQQGEDDLSSVGSPTPTPSVTSPSRSTQKLRTVPIRQPQTKRVTLRGARRGLAKSMLDFAQLKAEELRIIEAEEENRQDALQQSKNFEDKKSFLRAKMETIQGDSTESGVSSLRAEAKKVEDDIQELENKLFEMRARHRHLLAQATQLENSLDSKLSSYKSSLGLVEDQIKQFLRQPPVTHGLSDRRAPDAGAGMYALKPERRTLQMAQDQWSVEQQMLADHKIGTQAEKQALEEGAKLWRNAVTRINAFENELRSTTKTISASTTQSSLLTNHTNGESSLSTSGAPMNDVYEKLSEVISSLEADLEYAESKDWNLIICCLGAELAAFEQARDLLQDSHDPTRQKMNGKVEQHEDHTHEGPSEDLMRNMVATPSARDQSPSATTNRSLEDTLREFGDPTKGGERLSGGTDAKNNDHNLLAGDNAFGPVRTHDSRDESEDDDPGPDFFLSHT